MKRIAINGSNLSKRSFLAKAFSAMTGMDYIVNTPYSIIAYQYKLPVDISKCQWPDSFVYCFGAFIERILREKKLEDKFISDGGVFIELSWIKCRYSHIELIYERSMIETVEKVVMDYASKEYDTIFHIDSKEPSDAIDLCLKQLYNHHSLNHHIIDCANDEDALHQMLEHLQVKPKLSAKFALLKYCDEFLIEGAERSLSKKKFNYFES